jgi:multidrug efflux pump subunit AcrB
MSTFATRWPRILLVGLAVASGLLVGGLVFFAVRAAFWPSDSARRASPTDDWPALRIVARYEGANARASEDAVALPMETQMAGLERLETIESVSREGSATTTLYFRPGTDLDEAKVQAVKRLSLVLGILPDEVKMYGIRVTKAGPLPALWLIVESPDQSLGWSQLSDLAQTSLLPKVVAMPGVSGATAGAGDWRAPARGWVGLYLDSDKPAELKDVTLDEVKQALARRNEKDWPGEELANLVVKARGNGSIVRLGAVSCLVEYLSGPAEFALWNGRTAAIVAIESEEDPSTLVQAVQEQVPALAGLLPKGAELHLLPGPAIGGTEALLIDARLPDGSSEQRVNEIATKIAASLDGLADPRAERLIPAVLGLPSDEPTAFRLYVPLWPQKDRPWSSDEVAAQVQTLLAERPDVIFRINSPWVLNMPPLLRSQIVVSFSGPEDAALPVAEEVRGRLATSGVLSGLLTEYARPVPQVQIELEGSKLTRFGVKQTEVVTTLEIFLGRIRAYRQVRGDGIHWLLQASPTGRRAEDIENIKLRDDRGNVVPIGAVAKVRNFADIPYLRRIDGKRCMLFTAESAPGVSQRDAQIRGNQIAQEVIDQMGMSKFYSVLQK